MSIYQKLRASKPTLKVAKNSKEVIFTMVSCMCDNKHLIKLKKNSDGEFKINTASINGGYPPALSNFQLKHDIFEIEWAADEENWVDVINCLNSGTSVIESLRCR